MFYLSNEEFIFFVNKMQERSKRNSQVLPQASQHHTFKICSFNDSNLLAQCTSTDDCDNGEECIDDRCTIKGKSLFSSNYCLCKNWFAKYHKLIGSYNEIQEFQINRNKLDYMSNHKRRHSSPKIFAIGRYEIY